MAEEWDGAGKAAYQVGVPAGGQAEQCYSLSNGDGNGVFKGSGKLS